MPVFLVGMLATQGDPLTLDLAPDRTVIIFAIALGTLTCLLFGLIPVWRATRVRAAEAMRGILIDRARDKHRDKRGGGWRRLRLEHVDLPVQEPPPEILDLDLRRDRREVEG